MKLLGRLPWALGALTALYTPAVRGQGLQFNADLIELTLPAVEGLIRGLRVEIALRKELVEELAKYPTEQQYRACETGVAGSEEFQKILLSLDIPDNATTDDVRKIMARQQAEMQALLKKRCPLNPTEWTLERKAARLKEITERAAAAAGPVTTPGDSESEMVGAGPWLAGEGREPGITPPAYLTAKERAQLFCTYSREHGRADSDHDKLIRIPAEKSGIWWIFTPNEQDALIKKCDPLGPLFKQSNAYEPGGVNVRN